MNTPKKDNLKIHRLDVGIPAMTKSTTYGLVSQENSGHVGNASPKAGIGAAVTGRPLFLAHHLPSHVARIAITALLALLSAPSYANDIDRLISAMIQVESGGNYRACGDYKKGIAQAVGCLQIWPITVKDANRISGKCFTLEDRYDRAKSIEMCRIIITHYETTLEGMARRWNGGGNWRNIKQTEIYWQKVFSRMKNENR